MNSTLSVIIKSSSLIHTYNITEKQKNDILSVIDYTPEQYEILSNITGLSSDFFDDVDIDYWVE